MAKAKRKAKATKAKSKKSKRKVVAKSATRAKARKPQRFVYSHHREEDFDQGLRPYSAYRDLGIAPGQVCLALRAGKLRGLRGVFHCPGLLG